MLTNMALESLVSNFRKAIEAAIDNNEKDVFFKKFPFGQCGNTCDMLAQYLIDNGFSPVYYVNRIYYSPIRNDSQEHAWLEVNGQIVDITADQFKYKEKPLKSTCSVYVGPMNDYYKIFKSHPMDRCTHTGLDMCKCNNKELKKCYNTILKYLT